ncbi:MAG: hypothetical protein NTY64_20520, partial [Deltaproteobacteria bacterium]|nr:hypothetical protein [Deltaproteobacteria bacterium]
DEYLSYDMDLKRRAGFSSPELDKLVLEGLTTLDLKKRQAIYHEIGKKVAEESPIIYSYARPQRFEFWRDQVKGYVPTPQSSRIYLKQTWLEK